jgi:hypothetical protein
MPSWRSTKVWLLCPDGGRTPKKSWP